MSVASIIQDQIGGKSLYMIGAKDFRSLEGKGVSFRVMRNPKGVTHVAIYLDPSDTYRIKYIKQARSPSFAITVVKEESDIYADDLNRSIERNTGLATSLGTMKASFLRRAPKRRRAKRSRLRRGRTLRRRTARTRLRKRITRRSRLMSLFKVTDRKTGKVYHLTAEQLAALPSKGKTSATRGGKTITIMDIPEKDWVRGGVRHQRAALKGHHTDIVPNVSIRLYGIETNRVGGPIPYDITFKIGDHAVYGGYNLTYVGTIISIGAKSVAIKEDHGSTVHRLSIAKFSRDNSDYDAARIAKHNSEWRD